MPPRPCARVQSRRADARRRRQHRTVATLALVDTRTHHARTTVTAPDDGQRGDCGRGFSPDGRTIVTGRSASPGAPPPPAEVLVLRRTSGRRSAFARRSRFRRTADRLRGRRTVPARHERRDDLVPARRADLQARPHVSHLRRRGALAGRRHGGLRPERRQRQAARPAHRCRAVDDAPLDGQRGRARVQRRREGARNRLGRRQRRRLGRADSEPCARRSTVTRPPRARSPSARTATTLYSGSNDGSVIVWDVRGEPPPRPAVPLRPHPGSGEGRTRHRRRAPRRGRGESRQLATSSPRRGRTE